MAEIIREHNGLSHSYVQSDLTKFIGIQGEVGVS
jgi:hypothetical protein